MPLTSVTSYVTTLEQFQAHWTSVEATGVTITLPDATNKETFTDFQNEFLTQNTEIVTLQNDAEQARAEREIALVALYPVAVQFGAAARGGLGKNHPLVPLIAKAPTLRSAPEKITRYADDVISIWTRINALPVGSAPGITLPFVVIDPSDNGLSVNLAQFTARRANYADKASLAVRAEEDLRLKLSGRRRTMARLERVLTEYRAVILGQYLSTSTFVDTLPRVNARPGSTPPAVSAGGVWSAQNNVAVLTITPLSPDIVAQFKVIRYDVRYCPGPGTYKTDEEQAIGTMDLTQTTFETTTGLTVSGNTSLFRVYSVTGDGNERGSATIKVVRP